MLVEIYRDYIYNYLKRKFPRARNEDLEDSVQNTLIKAHRFIDQWDQRCSFKTWLSVIAFRMYTDTFRKTYTKHERLVESEEGTFIFDSISQDDFSETLCEEIYLTKLVNQLLSEYENNVHVNAFKMNMVDDIDYKDIAKLQNIPIGTVKSRIFRGKKLLQERYQQICNQDASLLV